MTETTRYGEATGAAATVSAYARTELRGEGIYRGYKPRTDVLAEVSLTLPEAHLVVVSGAWCSDCRREVPKMARILEHLPSAWTAEILDDRDPRSTQTYGVQAVPSFLVLDRADGQELGRITESPRSGDGLEGDLLEIARGR